MQRRTNNFTYTSPINLKNLLAFNANKVMDILGLIPGNNKIKTRC